MPDKKIDRPSDVEFAEAIAENIPQVDKKKLVKSAALGAAVGFLSRAKRK